MCDIQVPFLALRLRVLHTYTSMWGMLQLKSSVDTTGHDCVHGGRQYMWARADGEYQKMVISLANLAKEHNP